MFFFFLFFLILLTIICVILYKHVWVIPTKHFAIVERLGVFHKVLKPGMHFLLPFADNLKHLEWRWENKVIKGNMFYMDKRQMDIKPISCFTKDNLSITLDTTLFYLITKPEIAVYKTDDVLNLFYQTSVHCIRNVLNKIDASQLRNGEDFVISNLIKDSINKQLDDDNGISCVDILIQSSTASTVNSTNAKEGLQSLLTGLEQIRLEIEIFKMRKEAGIPTPQEIEFERAKKTNNFLLVGGKETN